MMISLNKETNCTLNYRAYQKDDLEGVLELWEKCSGWGAITEKQFNEWHIDTPYGSCLVVVAENSERKITGQLIFVPTLVYDGEKDNKAYRVMSPIVDESIRGQDIKDYNHPTYAMLRF